MKCPLCSHPQGRIYFTDQRNQYYQCQKCSLVFLSREDLLSFEDEKRRYEKHDNSQDNLEYIAYLDRIAQVIAQNLNHKMNGLDFGCGPTKLLEQIFKRKGFYLESFDPFFFPEISESFKTYDFLILSEVIEHFRKPNAELSLIKRLLKPQGLLFVKTKCLPLEKHFKDWSYRRDPTHVQFFSAPSFDFISNHFEFSRFHELGNDIYLFRNNI